MFMLPDLKPEEILIYLRKSRTDDPALSVAETVAKHEKMLDDWCNRNLGALVPEHNRFREIVSGETIEARPEVQKVLRLIEQPQFRAILIVEPQRLSRGDLEDIGRLSKLLRYTGTIVITLQYSYDLTDERDRDYFCRELKRGNEYLEYSKRIMMNGRTLSAEQGNFSCSRKPYGYKRIFVKDGKRKYPTLEIIPEEADIVRLIFRMYAEGSGATKISYHLNAIGSKPERGDHWTPPSIYDILDNPLYNGKIKWGYRKTVTAVEAGEIVKHSPRNKDCPVYEGKHEAIITDDLWSAVRKRRDAADVPRVKVSKQLQNPLSGLVWCSCGRMMIRRPHGSKCADRMQCPEQTTCGNASCTMQEMLDAVAGILRSAVDDFSVQIGSGSEEAAKRKEESLRILQSRLADLERKEVSLWEKFAEDAMPRNIFDELLAKNQKQKQEVAELIEKEQTAPHVPDYVERSAMFSDALAAIKNPDAPAAEINTLLKACIRRITYSRERGHRERGTRSRWTMPPMNLRVELNI